MGNTYGLNPILEGVHLGQQTERPDHRPQRQKRCSGTINGQVRGSHRCRPPRCHLQWTTARWAAQRMSGTRIFERRHKSLPNNFVVPFIDPKEKGNKNKKHDIISHLTSVLLVLTVSPSPPTSSIIPSPSTS